MSSAPAPEKEAPAPPEMQPVPAPQARERWGLGKWLPLGLVCVGLFGTLHSLPRAVSVIRHGVDTMFQSHITRHASINRGLTPFLHYPQTMLRAKIEGGAEIKCVIDNQGHAQSCSIASASNPVFGAAALDYFVRAVYYPALRNGEPVVDHYHAHVRFHMRGNGAPPPPPPPHPPATKE